MKRIISLTIGFVAVSWLLSSCIITVPPVKEEPAQGTIRKASPEPGLEADEPEALEPVEEASPKPEPTPDEPEAPEPTQQLGEPQVADASPQQPEEPPQPPEQSEVEKVRPDSQGSCQRWTLWNSIKPSIAEHFIQSMAISPDGKHVALGHNYIGLDVVRYPSLQLAYTIKNLKSDPKSVAFNATSQLLGVVEMGKGISVWNVATGKLKKGLPGFAGQSQLMFHPSIETLVYFGMGSSKQQLMEFDILNPSRINIAKPYGYRHFDIHPQGTALAFGGQDLALTTLPITGKSYIPQRILGRYTSSPQSTRFSPDGSLLGYLSSQVIQSGNPPTTRYISAVHLVSTTTYKPSNPTGHTIHHKSVAQSFAIGHKVDQYFVGFEDGTIHVWDMKGTKVFNFKAHKGKVTKLYSHPTDRALFSVGSEGVVKIWKCP